MKILHAINSLQIGGAERLIVQSCPLYRSKGIVVDVLTLTSHQTFFSEELGRQGVAIRQLTRGSIYNPFLIFKLIPLLKKYDIIHVHLFPTSYWFALAKLLSWSKSKLVLTEHSPINRRRNAFFRLIDRFLFRQYCTIVSISQNTNDHISKHLGYKDSRFKIIYNGIDVQSFNDALPYNKSDFFSNDYPIVMQVSSFRIQKDHDTLIKAIANLPFKANLLLVGDGPIVDKSKALVEELRLTEQVKFLGNRADVPRLLNTTDIVVLSSKYEGFGLAIVEGMAANKPCVASNVPGLQEIMEGYGLLFEPGNVAQLSKYLNDLITDPILYDKVKKSCWHRAQKYELQNMIDAHIKLYQSLCQNQN